MNGKKFKEEPNQLDDLEYNKVILRRKDKASTLTLESLGGRINRSQVNGYLA